ncbi:hypothetical protein [Candidatus Kuenenia sp.]|uniref:hypothetical protein n=1 Tax=Candidatus Kuenenia sp. TaxID=2499824 RepID=UPI0032208E88
MHRDNQSRIAAALERIASNKQSDELGKLRLLIRIADSLERIANSLNRLEAKRATEGE